MTAATPGTIVSMRAIRRARRRATRRDFLTALRHDRPAIVGVVVLTVVVMMAIAAPVISPTHGLSPVDSITNPLWAPPSREFPLGTDNLGRSVAAQFVWGARVSLVVGLAAAVLTVGIGSAIGLVAGFFGGWVNAVFMRMTDWFLVIPFLPLAIVLASILSRSLQSVIIVIAITSWPGTARLVCSQVLTAKRRLFVDRARALGGGRWHTIRRHVLPTVGPLILANVTLAVPIAILTETTLAFLGLGDPTRPSWGKMLEEAFSAGAITRQAWWYYVPPGLGVVTVVLAITMIGRAIEEVLDPRLRER